MTVVTAAHGVVPPHRYRQEQITEAFGTIVLGADSVAAAKWAVLRRIHGNAGVEFRHLALPIEEYSTLTDFTAANDAWLRVALDLGQQAVEGALRAAGIAADQVDLIVFTTVTGVVVPSLDARLARRLGLRSDVKRMPLFGLGCVAGAAGVARVHDYLTGHPDGVAVLLSVELCSLTLQRDDRSMANLISSGLFGDGAAAVVAVGSDLFERHSRVGSGAEVLDTCSHLYPDTERTMGWDIGARGLSVVLGAEVPALVTRYLGGDIKMLLHEHGYDLSDVDHWVSHPGGPKVIQAIEAELGYRGRPAGSPLAATWRSLAAVGNLSSASALQVLGDTLDRRPEPGGLGMMMAMGPGFCSELVLLRWR